MNRTLQGRQIRTIMSIRGYGGDVPRNAIGTIFYEHEDGLGGVLVRVCFEDLRITRDVLWKDIVFCESDCNPQ